MRRKWKIVMLLLSMVCVLGIGIHSFAEDITEEERIDPGEGTEAAAETEEGAVVPMAKGPAGITYSAHVQNKGWNGNVADGTTAGTVGYGLRTEAIKINLQNLSGTVYYKTKGLNSEWQDWKQNGDISGSVGKSTGLERIQIKLDETLNQSYNVYYRVHVAKLGWLGWTSNGEIAGTEYYEYSIEAIQIKILAKDDTSAPAAENAYKQKNPDITYQAHVSNIGWQSSVINGAVGGTTGQSKKMEAIKIKIPGIQNAELQYRTKSLNQSWQAWKSNNEQAGTTGQKLGLEQIQIKLSGELAQSYNVYYRVHVANLGWLGWTQDGEIAGSSYHGGAIEAIEIKLIKKGDSAPSIANAFIEKPPSVSYSAHVSSIGWQANVKDGVTGGTTGQSKKMEAIKIQIANTQTTDDITYSTRSIGKSWGAWQKNNAVSGTTGQKLSIDAIKIKLSDSLSQKYSVYYRVHVSNIGWLGWTKDGGQAGSEGFGYAIEAVQIKITEKEKGETESKAYVKMPSLTYQAYVSSIGWQPDVINGNTAGTTGQSKGIEALRILLTDNETYAGSISYRTRGLKSTSWGSWKADGEMTGSTDQSESLEAVQIKLIGNLANVADVYYRAHVQGLGWLDWTKNGYSAGSEYYGYRIEAIQIKILSKSDSSVKTGTAYALGWHRGVDVSAYNGTIDWGKVKNAGISFAMLRIVNGRMGNLQVDATFNTNIRNATANGIKVGGYRYGYAITVAQAQEEARQVVKALKESGGKVQYPIVYDVEDADTQGKLTKAELTSIIKAFKGIVENNGYKFIIYANKSWLENKLDMETFANEDIWIARYRDNTWDLGHGYTGKGNVTMWQYTSSGTVEGINGVVDMNICYKQY